MKYRLEYKAVRHSGEWYGEGGGSFSSDEKRVFSANTDEEAQEKAMEILKKEEKGGSRVLYPFTTLVRIEQEEIAKKMNFVRSPNADKAREVCSRS